MCYLVPNLNEHKRIPHTLIRIFKKINAENKKFQHILIQPYEKFVVTLIRYYWWRWFILSDPPMQNLGCVRYWFIVYCYNTKYLICSIEFYELSIYSILTLQQVFINILHTNKNEWNNYKYLMEKSIYLHKWISFSCKYRIYFNNYFNCC